MAGPNDDLLPNPWLTMRRDTMQSIRTLLVLYGLTVLLAWSLLPWRLGWRGVGMSLWLTFGFAYGSSSLWFSKWLRKRIDA